MTTQPDDGGPVYPTTEANYQQDYCGTGISLRDLCAIEVMKSVYTDVIKQPPSDEHWRMGIAFDCYRMADAMLAARGK